MVRFRAITSVPPDHRWSLWLLYVVFALVVAALYPVCRWFDRVKAQRESGWIRYISPTVYGVWCGRGLNRDSLRLAQRGSQTPRRRGLKAPLHSEHM